MTITTSKDVNGEAPVAAKQPGFMTYEEAELQMKHGHSIRRASWPTDMHLTDGKVVGGDGPLVEADDPDHDPSDSNPDETRKMVKAAMIATGKKPEKKAAAAKPEAKKVEKDDKSANDWTFWFDKKTMPAG